MLHSVLLVAKNVIKPVGFTIVNNKIRLDIILVIGLFIEMSY